MSITYNNLEFNEDYAQANNVWGTLNVKSLGHYHDIFLATEVLFSTDVIERFSKTSHRNYGIDCAKYVSAASFRFDGLLKSSKVELQLLSDVDMHSFAESGIKVGLSFISKKHAKANNSN